MHISYTDVNAWFEETKLSLASDDVINTDREDMLATLILSKLSSVFDISTWLDANSTPKIVKTVISMYYAAWTYDVMYGDNAEEPNVFAMMLRRTADANINGMLTGQIEVLEQPLTEDVSGPLFFPTDFSSTQQPTDDNPEWGPPAFTMGQVF